MCFVALPVDPKPPCNLKIMIWRLNPFQTCKLWIRIHDCRLSINIKTFRKNEHFRVQWIKNGCTFRAVLSKFTKFIFEMEMICGTSTWVMGNKSVMQKTKNLEVGNKVTFKERTRLKYRWQVTFVSFIFSGWHTKWRSIENHWGFVAFIKCSYFVTVMLLKFQSVGGFATASTR